INQINNIFHSVNESNRKLLYGTDDEVLSLLKKVVSATDSDASFEMDSIADNGDPNSSNLNNRKNQNVKRRSISMEAASGGDDMVYMNVEGAKKSKLSSKPTAAIVHPLFKKFRNK
ncbi:MAG: TFIIH basal transcription factor complex helicase XPB subunit, partial [Paramarteilia canceri]